MFPASIGRYEIKAEIGHGGMSAVYEGYDPSFERPVAIKVLPPAFLHESEFRNRFQREARLIASLEHPAIVPVYDLGEDQNQLFIVMRYMAGGSLVERINKGPISTEETSRIISRLAPALDAAHARGIIHRDIKPGNILYDQYGNAFLSDFGIARLSADGNSTLTQGGIVGTPAYMSPEQVQGEKDVDGRSDIYSMGVLIFQMLAGRVPYQGDTPVKTMMMQILEPVPQIAEDRPDLPRAVGEIIQKAMAKEPNDRYSKAIELAVALENAVLTSPTLPRNGSNFAATIVLHPKDPLAQTESPVASATSLSPTTPSSTIEPPSPIRKSHTGLVISVSAISLLILGLLAILGMALTTNLRGMPAIVAASASNSPAAEEPTGTPIPPSSTAVRDVIKATEVPVVLVIPTNQEIPPAPTITYPSPTPIISQPAAPPLIGGADKIAYLSHRDIYMANLDGTDLVRLTADGSEKRSLQWSHDGKSILYLSGKCLFTVDVDSLQSETITCFNFTDSVNSFRLSNDGGRAALSLDNQLFIIPFDVDALKKVKNRNKLAAMAECKNYAPYARNLVKDAYWSKNDQYLALILLSVVQGKRADVIQVIDATQCTPDPHIEDNFPPPRFQVKGYDRQPVIQNIGWNGEYLFALTNNIRNDGFGDLYLYNMQLYKAYPAVNPVQQKCCYRDPQWSPDGNFLIFAFQDIGQGANSVTLLYYIPYGSIGSNATYEPLPLSPITDPHERPSPILRPYQQ
jgi:serine/threonine-protein kinase